MKQLVFWLFFCLAMPAVASPNETANTRFEEARTYYYLQQYNKALAGFQEAYLLSSNPVLLLNIAQCYRQLARYEEALRGYSAYLDADPKTTYRQKVESLIEEVKEKQKTTLTTQPTEPAAVAPAVSALKPVSAAEREIAMSTKRVIGISAGAFLLGIGSGALAITLVSEEPVFSDALPPSNDTGGGALGGGEQSAATTPNYLAIGAVSIALVTGGVLWWKMTRKPVVQKPIEAVF